MHLCDLNARRDKGKRKPSEVKEDVLAFKKEFNQVKYGFQSVEEAISYIKKNVSEELLNVKVLLNDGLEKEGIALLQESELETDTQKGTCKRLSLT